MPKSVLGLAVITEDEPVALAAELISNQPQTTDVCRKLAEFFGSLSHRGAKVVAWMDKSTDGSTEKAGDSQTATVTITHANLTAGDTLTVGGTTLTWDTDMSIGSDAGADGDNLAAAINASSTLAGLFAASSNGSGVVTITAYGAPRVLRSFGLTKVETLAGMALSAAHFGLDSTDASVIDPVIYSDGAVA